MRALPDNSVDSIVTDPPYELTSARPGGRSPATRGKVMKGFMGMEWDGSGIANNPVMWAEALRVLKPGGHLLAFSGSRTYHRMTCAIEDAGFEVRDQIMWVYGSGFPKSLDVSKAIDKAAGAVREMVRVDKIKNPPNLVGGVNNGGGGRPWQIEAAAKGFHEVAGDVPVTDAARQWEGWGTALKPAHEPICVARKPLIGTVAANVLAHGTGALNIDGCRVGNEERTYEPKGTSASAAMIRVPEHRAGKAGDEVTVSGRWPANLIHSGCPEVLALFPDAKGQQGVAKTYGSPMGNAVYGAMNHGTKNPQPRIETETSAARFFYCAKTSKADRNEGLSDPGPQFKHGATLRQIENVPKAGNSHPTVKPTELMAYLCRLVTPPGGLILDPFMGSGSTGKAAMREGFRFIGCELSAEYLAIAEARISHELIGDLV